MWIMTKSLSDAGWVVDKDDRWVWTRSSASLRARDARVRASLATEAPILGGRCPDSQARLFDFSVQLRDRAHVDKRGLSDAASELLLWQQYELLGRRSLGTEAAFELFSARAWALQALIHALPDGYKGAKRREMEITEGAPHGICMGRLPHRVAPNAHNVNLDAQLARHYGRSQVGIPLVGCMSVFADSTNVGRGRMWSSWCPRCSPELSQSARAQARQQIAALRANRRRSDQPNR